MIGFINAFYYNLSSSQSITIIHKQFSAKHFFLDCRGLAPFSFLFCDSFDSVLYSLYSLEADPTENIVFQLFMGVFTAPWPRNRRPIAPRYTFAGTCYWAVAQQRVSMSQYNRMVWWPMNWKGLGRKSWSNRGVTLIFAMKEWEESWKPSVRI
jgi:hypothetical protein